MRLSLALLLALGLALPTSAAATFPGSNGGIAFSVHGGPDPRHPGFLFDHVGGVGFAPAGTWRPQLFGYGLGPAFSPSGRRIAYSGDTATIWLARPGCRWRALH